MSPISRAPAVTVLLLTVAALLVDGSPGDARIAANRIAANRLTANEPAAVTLATAPLAGSKRPDGTFALNTQASADLMATADGREVLGYVVSCALPQDITLIGTQDAVDYEFNGELGLAKSWLRRPLNAPGQGWVTACLLARTNDNDVAVDVSLRGTSHALATDPQELSVWTLEEGAFYGNLFATDGEEVACRGRDAAAAGARQRVCAEPDPNDATHTQCGFGYAGDCGDFAPPPACEKFVAPGFYKSCHDQPIVPHQHSPRFRQVITTFVQP